MTTLAMDYFRRPQLSGHTLTHETFATIRGDIRRSDLDGISAVPYFPGVTAAQTLILKIDGGGPITVVFNGAPPGGLTNVLNDINTALGITATAFDADGTIAIQTSTVGSLGSVEVTGGTAAAALGFDLTLNSFKSFGGEIQSTPEARRGNPFGTGFLSRGENFTAESVQRGLARISSNVDVLYSDLVRNDAVIRKVGYTTADNTFFQLATATDELFTGLGLLSNASTKDDLAQYFYLIDPVTKKMAQSRVVGVVRGAPGGLPPFANATTWTGGGSDGNILGVTLSKISAAAITEIYDGRVVKVGVSLADVQPGDFAEIAGATNNTQWNNNGNRWVVESVLSSNTCALRPMSKSELAMVGFTPADVQPIIELNDNINGGESYGTLTIRTGTYCSGGGGIGISVFIDPPMPTGAAYDLYVAQPISARVRTVSDSLDSASLPFKDLVTDFSPTFDGTVIGLHASKGLGSCVITAGSIRWRGRVYHLPGATFGVGAFTNNSPNWVYWDDATTSLVITNNPSDFASLYDPFSLHNKGNLVAYVQVFGGVIQFVSSSNRLVADAARNVTVGFGGQFSNLDDALNYLNAFSAAFSETTSSSGSFPHCEIQIVGDTTYSGAVLLMPSISIRGVSQGTRLTLDNTIGLDFAGSMISIENLSIVASGGTISSLVQGAASNPFATYIRNVSQVGGLLTAVVADDGTSLPTNVYIENSNFSVNQYVVKGTPFTNAGDIRLINSSFNYGGGGSPQIISDSAAATWSGQILMVQGCTFSGNWLTATTGSLFVNAANASSRVVVEDSVFTLGLHNFTARTFMTVTAGKCMFKGNRVTGGIASLIKGSAATIVLNNYLECVGNNNEIAVEAGYTIGNELVQFDNGDVGTLFGSVGIRVQGEAIGNYLHGPFQSAIVNSTASMVRIHGNRIEMADGVTDIVIAGILLNGGSNISVVGNSIRLTGTDPNGLKCIQILNTAITEAVIADNVLVYEGGTGFLGTNVGIDASSGGAHTSFSITGNTIVCEHGGDTNYGLNIPSLDNVTVSGNTIQLPTTGGGTATGIALGTNPDVTITGNYVLCTGVPFNGGGSPQETWVISGNIFITATSGGGAIVASGLRGTITGNRFDFEAPAAACKISSVSGRFNGNYVNGKVVLGGNGSQTVTFNDNWVTSDCILPAASAVSVVCSNNIIQGLFDGTTNTPTISNLTLEGNRIGGAFTVSSASTFDANITNNFFGTSINLSWSGGNVVVSGNDFNGGASGTAINLGNAVDSSLSFVSNILTGGTLVASRAQLHGNTFSGNIHIFKGLGTKNTSCAVIGNVFTGGDLTTELYNTHVANNDFGTFTLFSSIVHQNGEGGGVFECIGNRVSGTLDIDNSLSGGSILDVAIVTDNYITNPLGNSSSIIKASDCNVSGNMILPRDGASLEVDGVRIHVNANTLNSTTNSTANNQGTLLKLNGSSLTQADGNYVYGRVTVADTADLFFSDNYVYNLAANNSCPGLDINAVSESMLLDGNFVGHELVNIATDGTVAAVRFTGASNVQHGRISNNRFRIVNLSVHYSGNQTISVIQKTNAALFYTIIADNRLTKPSSATIDGHTITLNYMTLANGQVLVFSGNLMDHAGTVSTTGSQATNICQGAWLYTVGTIPLFVDET